MSTKHEIETLMGLDDPCFNDPDYPSRKYTPTPYDDGSLYTNDEIALASMQAGSQFPKFDPTLNYWVCYRGWRRFTDTEWFINHMAMDGHETDADDVVCELIDMWEGRLP